MIEETPLKLIKAGWLTILVNLAVVIAVVFGVRFAEVKKVPIQVWHLHNDQFVLTTLEPVKKTILPNSISCEIYYGEPQKSYPLVVQHPRLRGANTWQVTIHDTSRMKMPVNIITGDTLSGLAGFVSGSSSFFGKMWK